MDADAARERFAQARSARLATVTPEGAPHLVPICFVLAHNTVHSVVDGKPKRTARLQRLVNVAANPSAALLADHYEDADWNRLWWVRADGRAIVLDPEAREALEAVERLIARYPRYRVDRPAGPVLEIRVERWSGWAAAGS